MNSIGPKVDCTEYFTVVGTSAVSELLKADGKAPVVTVPSVVLFVVPAPAESHPVA